MDKQILKIETLKSSVHLGIQWLIEEHDEVLNSAKDNGTTETIEEIEKFCQILEDQKGDAMEIDEGLYMLRWELKALQHSFNIERSKSEKVAKTIQVLQKDLKLENQQENQQKI